MDSDAFERLKNGNDQEIRDQFLVCRDPFVRYIITAFRCQRSMAEDIYPEAFSILYFNIQREKLKAPLQSTMQTYLNSVGWNLFHRRYRDKYNRDKVSSEISESIPAKQWVDQALIQLDRAQHVQNLLDTLGDPCKSLLHQVYYEEKSYAELSINLSVTETTLRKRKFDCLEKMRKLIDQNKLEL